MTDGRSSPTGATAARGSLLGRLRRRVRWYRATALHRLAGSPVPPPHDVKLFWIHYFSRRFGLRTLVETGTYRGATVAAMAPFFDRLYSIELDAGLHARAAERFDGWRGLHLLSGDSRTVLPTLLTELVEPGLFWLDGHYSGPGTAGARDDAPLTEELAAIRSGTVETPVILIDDARLLGSPGYPDPVELQDYLARSFPGTRLRITDDMLQLFPTHRKTAP